MSNASYSIIIPVYRDPDGLTVTLATLSNSISDPKLVEIIIAADGSHPNDIDVARKFAEESLFAVKVHALEKQSGSYGARNAAIAITSSDILFFLDAGVEVDPSWFNEIRAAISGSDYVAGEVVVPLAYAKSNCEVYNALTAFDVSAYMKKFKFGVTANLAVRKKVFDQLGIFDSRLASGGDLEFGDRVAKARLRQIYCPKARVLHAPRNLEKMKKKIIRTQEGVADLIKFYPERFGFLRYRFDTKNLIISTIKKLLKLPFSKFHKLSGSSLSRDAYVLVIIAYHKYKSCTKLRNSLP